MSTVVISSSKGNSNKSIERHLLPPVGRSANERLQDPSIKLSDLSALTPKADVGLLFVAPGMYWGREENHQLEKEVAAAYGRHIGSKLIVVGCNECLMEAPHSLRSCDGPRGPANGSPGLLFWPSAGLRVRVSHDDLAQHRYTSGEMKYLVPNRIESLVSELELDDSDESTLLVFVNAFPAYIPATACLFNALQGRCKGKKTSVWGGYFNDDVSVAENVGAGNCLVKGALFVLIRLTGGRLNSTSAIVHCNKSRRKVDEQLRHFKSKLRLRRRSVLLISGPVEIDAGDESYANCQEFKEAAMRILNRRGVQILGAFSNMPHAIGIDTTAVHDSNEEQRYLWHNCMSLMMLTYD